MSENATSETSEENAANDRPRDRHLGTRENIWFPADEHAAMVAAMAERGENNKSGFVRAAVRRFIGMEDK